MQKTILAVHLYNDFSGSPKVLAKQLQEWKKEGRSPILLTSNSQGFLSNQGGIMTYQFNYKFHDKKSLRLWHFLVAQLLIMIRVWQLRKEISCVYVNTLLPFGAALAGRICGKKVVYHIHETSVNPAILKNFLKTMAQWTASHIIYVSHFLRKTEAIKNVPATVIYNSLDESFLARAETYLKNTTVKQQQAFTCLMACSLKQYKGIDQYRQLAELLPDYRFELVLNASSEAISSYFSEEQLPANLVIFPVQQDMHWFYQRADLVLNLSLPDQWVETFGMTLLEGMAYGKAVIGPTVGGPTEVIINRHSGYTISAYEIDRLKARIIRLAENSDLYQQIARNAYQQAQSFLPSDQQQMAINQIICPAEAIKTDRNLSFA